MNEWKGFVGTKWQETIDVKDFILANYTYYDGDESFLEGATARTKKVLNKVTNLLKQEADNGGVLDVDTNTVSSILSFPTGYIDKENDIIVGLQTDKPLKRAVVPFGGIRMSEQACKAYGYELSDKVKDEFKYRTTHNDGVFNVYSDEMKRARHVGLITGLPDTYSRGRIIGDYRRIALYGMDRLIAEKIKDKQQLQLKPMLEENIKLIEEVHKQISFMHQLKDMAKAYGYDISHPASTAKEAVQWLYFGYLGAVKEQNGAANSIGRIITFLDIYFSRDLNNGLLTESEAQEIMDDFILKLRMVRHLRIPEYNELFAGDPVWVTISDAGLTEDNKPMVTKNSYRLLNTLYNLGSSSEPNITILWSEKLPTNYKNFCAKTSIDTDSIQYENDDLMREIYGCDYSIACCVSAMKTGKQMQYFGARCNLAKTLLLGLNGGKDEIQNIQVGPIRKSFNEGLLNYDEVLEAYDYYSTWVANLYVNTLNVIHFMHDKYAYERLMMSLHDTDVDRLMAFGISGFSVVVDSLSAIKYAKVYAKKDDRGIISDFTIEGEYPKYGNDDDRVDDIARFVVKDFYEKLCKIPTYRNAKHTLSILTITSNVVYGKKTGSTPDGRKKGEPFAPGANPMHERDKCGAIASLNSVAKIDYKYCMDGISNTFSIEKNTLGKTIDNQKSTLVSLLDGYFGNKAQHLNVNVLSKNMLIDAMNNRWKYPNLTIRVSGYAVNFNKLSLEQQKEVISRTYHTSL